MSVCSHYCCHILRGLKYTEAVKMANTGHQILSAGAAAAAALVSCVWEAARESETWPTRLFIQKLE